MKLRVKELQNQDGKFLILENDAIGQNLLDGKRWEPHFTSIVRKLVKQGDAVVDAGANFGHHTVILAEQVGVNGLVHAFEPMRVIHQQLCANVFSNGLTNVHTHQFALGDYEDIITMQPVNYFANWVNIGDTEANNGGGEKVMIHSYDLEGLERYKEISFAKIDVQGCELKLLTGAQELVTNDSILFVEVEDLHLRHFGTSPKELIDYIKDYDYDVYQIANDYPCDHICFPRRRAGEVELIRESSLYKLISV